MTTNPDIFINVHKGIRSALFKACTALGRAGDDADRDTAARILLQDALHFAAHHGENEDLLLLPLLEEREPALFARMTDAHDRVNETLSALIKDIKTAPAHELYDRTCVFIALYLDHMREEEHELDPLIRAVLSVEELAGIARQSVERTAPADQRMMLGWMLPAMTRTDASAYLAKLPGTLADQLRRFAI